jgi:hypothetical protein
MVDEKIEEKKLDISEGTKKAVKAIAEEFSKEIKDAKDKFLEIYNNPVVAKQKNREELALKMMRGAFSSEFGRPTQEYEFYVAQKTSPREYPRKDNPKEVMRVANIYGFAVNKSEGESAKIRYAQITHFDKDANLVNTVEQGKMYKVRLSGKLEGNMFKLSATDVSKYTLMEGTPEAFSDPVEVIRKLFPKCELAEGMTKVGDQLCLIEGTIANVALIPLKSGKGKLGLITLIDDSLTAKDLKDMGGGVTVMIDPSQVKYGQLSQVAILGNFTNHPTYGLGINGQMILPIVAFDYEPPRETVKPEDTGLTADNGNETVVEISDEELEI